MCINKKQDIDVQLIIQEIRKELERRDNCRKANKNIETNEIISYHLHKNLDSPKFKSKTIYIYPIFSVKNNGKYHVNDFLHYHKDEFIKNAYLAILLREADPAGLHIFLKRLDSGMSKIEILGRMRYSPEGRKRSVKVKGLLLPLTAQIIYKIPVLSYFCQLAISLLKLPKALRDHMEFNHYSLYLNKKFQTQFNQNLEAIEHEFFKNNEAITEYKFNLINLNEKLKNISKRFNERLILIEKQMNTKMNKNKDVITLLNESVIAIEKQIGIRINELNKRLNQFENDLINVDSRKAEREEIINLAEQKTDREETHQIRDQNYLNRDETHQIRDEIYQIKADIKESSIRIHDQKLCIIDQHRRIKLFLEEARERLPKIFQPQKIKRLVKEKDHLLDALYVSFEDRFRGSREDIKALLAEYLPYIAICNERTENAPILDIGCGRGEWLELCRENGLNASGVDTNNVMISLCSEFGLFVTQMDGIQFLKEQKSDTYGVITGFHFIEHIEYQERIVFFDETLRVLKSGGAAIFETPNPENIIVGAFSFYMDPTHISPLVPETMQFILEQRGFINVEIKRLHKNRAYYSKKNDSEFKNKWFYNAMDYALIGYKK